ncbi:MAG TPA: hypothetical protein PLF84_23930 [Bryobacteraceae bacterium]|nr:hypothetical protein [Bryobacterales bacterium]HRJ22115.1 hypothetical protein [Bryobacteraceae bacterium]
MKLLAILGLALFLPAAAQTVKLTVACADEEIREFGLVCDEDEPCPVYLEIAGVEPVGARLFAVGNLHTGTATLWSVLMMSEDGGKVWTEPYPRQKSVAFDMVQFVDFENGWVSGHQAGSLARDPFLLRTVDAGKTWRKIPLYRDSTVAFIEQFWFETKEQGTLIVERRGAGVGRYQRLETRDGGATWMMREAGEDAIDGKRAKGAVSMNADWRVRADAKANQLRIEKREGRQWRAVAAFPLVVGRCEPRVVEDPVETEPPA